MTGIGNFFALNKVVFCSCRELSFCGVILPMQTSGEI